MQLKFGPSELASPLDFELGPVTIFVGPNNSGKSLLLREIENCTEEGWAGIERVATKVLDGFEPEIPDEQEVKQLLLSREVRRAPLTPAPGEYLYVPPEGYIQASKINLVYDQYAGEDGFKAIDINLEPTLRALEEFRTNPELVRDDRQAHSNLFSFLWLFVVRLDGRTRLTLTEPRPAGDLLGQPQNHLWALAQDESARERLRKISYDAFGRYFVLDPTAMKKFRIKMSDTEPPPAVEENIGQDSRKFFEQAVNISELSDGVKSFIGLTAAVLSADFRVMLIDEPEAFLHPVLAKKLGRRLTELASDRKGNVLASTHSPDFLMGCVETGEVNVVRLTYKQEVPSARLLPAGDLRQMMRDPLLRSTGILSALFHEGAIVCEGDADRAFYQEINHRLITAESTGADNSIFLNAQGKDTIPRMIKPLREMGIPAAAIVDVDILKTSNTFINLLEAAMVPGSLRQSYGGLRGTLNGKLISKDNEYKTKGGIRLLDTEDREAAQTLLDGLAEYGVFVVAMGELESWLGEWLRSLNISPAKRNYVPQVFEAMGSEATDPQYLMPQEGDVWDFMRKLGAWMADPRRKGIPA